MSKPRRVALMLPSPVPAGPRVYPGDAAAPPPPPPPPTGPLVIDDFERFTVLGQIGVTPAGRSWVVDAAAACQYSVGGTPGRLFVQPDGDPGPHLGIHLEPLSGDPWTVSPVTLRSRFMVEGANHDVSYYMEIAGASCTARCVVSFDPISGFVGVDDPGNGWFASVPKTDWLTDEWYIMEFLAEQAVGLSGRVYLDGDTPPAWTSFAYDDGSVVGIDASCSLGLDLRPFLVNPGSIGGSIVNVDWVEADV